MYQVIYVGIALWLNWPVWTDTKYRLKLSEMLCKHKYIFTYCWFCIIQNENAIMAYGEAGFSQLHLFGLIRVRL